MPKPLKHHEFKKRLNKYGKEAGRHFELDDARGKGSHRYLKEVKDGAMVNGSPVPWHDGKDIPKGILSSLIRKFGLPKRLFD